MPRNCAYLLETPDLRKALQYYQKYLGLDINFAPYKKDEPCKLTNCDFFLVHNSIPEQLRAIDILQGLHILPQFSAVPLIWVSEELSPAIKPFFDEVEFVWSAPLPFDSNEFFKILVEVQEYYDKNIELMLARTNIGLSLAKKDFQTAKILFEKIAADYPHTFRKHLINSEIFYGLNMFEPSLEECLKAKELIPTSLEADVLLSKIYHSKGDHDKYQAVLSNMTKKAEIHLKNLIHWGTVYTDRGDINKALTAYEQVLAKDEKNIEAREGAIAANLIAGREGIAKQLVDNAPQSVGIARVCNMRGIAMANQGQYKLAETLYRNAMGFLPDREDLFRLWINLGLCMKKKGDFAKAIEMFSKAKNLAPDDFQRVDEQIDHTNALMKKEQAKKAREAKKKKRRVS